MANLLRLILLAVVTSSTLAACSFLAGNSLSSPNKSLENTPLPSVANIDPKSFEPERIPDAPYLQTPPEVVIEMLEMAKVSQTDVVYDLGSGDGRISIPTAFAPNL